MAGAEDGKEKKPYNDPNRWCAAGHADANMSEVLLWALMLCVTHVGAVKKLETWARAVINEAPEAEALRTAWVPSWPKSTVYRVSAIFDPICYAYQKVQWTEQALDSIGLAMQAWCDDGRVDKLTGILLKKYVYKPRLGPAKPESRREPPPRYRSWAIVRVARLLLDRGAALRRLLLLDADDEQALPSHVVMERLSLRVELLEAELREQQAASKRLQDAWRKAANRVKKKCKAVTEARRDERAKCAAMVKEGRADAKRKISEHKATVRDEIGAEFSKRLATARAKARTYEKTAGLSKARLKRARDAEHELEATRQKLDELFEEQDAEDKAAALVKIQSMPRRGGRSEPPGAAAAACSAPTTGA